MAEWLSVHLDEVESTQDEARLRFDGSPILVTAGSQTAGRGRNDAEWVTAPRAVAASLAFDPPALHVGWTAPSRSLLTLLAGLAVAEVVDVELKWPNDLLSLDRKVGGILTESFDGVVVAGLGLNLWWPEAPDGVGALNAEDPGAEPVRTIAELWVDLFLERVGMGPGEWGRSEYRTRCVTLGRAVRWNTSAGEEHGTAIDIDDRGALIVETAAGRRELTSGAVFHVRPED